VGVGPASVNTPLDFIISASEYTFHDTALHYEVSGKPTVWAHHLYRNLVTHPGLKY